MEAEYPPAAQAIPRDPKSGSKRLIRPRSVYAFFEVKRKRAKNNLLFSLENLERAKGFEPSTPTLARLCSTPELRPLGAEPLPGEAGG